MRILAEAEELRVTSNGRHRWLVGDAGYETPCWIWLLYRDPDGYGKAVVEEGEKRTSTTAQRWVYERVLGPVPEGMTLDHQCPNRCCVNPHHMEPVPHIENVRRSRVRKLTQESADAIRSRRGTASARRVAEEFGIGHTTVFDIWHGRRWAA
jgi:hypothetical protein